MKKDILFTYVAMCYMLQKGFTLFLLSQEESSLTFDLGHCFSQ